MDSAQLARLYNFSGKTIVVTGGTGILGREMAGALVGCGANVAILGRNMDQAKQILDHLGTRAHQAIAVQADVVNQDSLRDDAETIKARFGTIYGLLNAAGGNKPQATTSPDLSFFDMPAEAVRGVFDLNLMGTVLPTQVFGKIMAENGEGVILNVSSMSAIRPLTRVMAYSAAKAAVDSFTQWLAVHVARGYSAKIRVNAIAPGFFLTQQNKFILTEEKSGQLTARGHSIIEHTPMARFGQPEDLLGAVLWLMSPASAFVTGIVVPVDGGGSAFGGV